jgi:hypothetical protein
LHQDSLTVKEILLGIDGSKTSLEAADQAIYFAEKHKAKLTDPQFMTNPSCNFRL